MKTSILITGNSFKRVPFISGLYCMFTIRALCEPYFLWLYVRHDIEGQHLHVFPGSRLSSAVPDVAEPGNTITWCVQILWLKVYQKELFPNYKIYFFQLTNFSQTLAKDFRTHYALPKWNILQERWICKLDTKSGHCNQSPPPILRFLAIFSSQKL